MAKVKKKTKKELLQEKIAEAVGAGRELHLESVDFSDPNRPKTCLEVDFPILPINHVAAIEGNAGKPIYQMSKWWARRRSSVFRAMLIAAATKAPDDDSEAARTVWNAYYGNHQKNPAFQRLKVADIFMGGGTTIVEGARLGMQMYGNDLNPVAWLVVKNELAQVEPEEVKKLLDAIEAEVKPQIMPFYACDCPRGHKGKWTRKSTGEVMGGDFDPLSLTPGERADFDYEGPEVIYTFWAKHGPCQATECNHRTPIMTTPVVAVKTLTVKAWAGKACKSCQQKFDIEQKDARMAPAALFVVAEGGKPYSVMDDEGRYQCPHCQHEFHDSKAATEGKSASLGKAKNKKIDLTLLVHPDWLKGSPGKDENGNWYGGSVTDTAEATAAWNAERAKTLKLIEVRGKLPEQITCPDTGEEFYSDNRGGTVPGKSKFKCQEDTCGRESDLLQAVQQFGKSAPFAPYVVHGSCPTCNQASVPYGGRFFAAAESSQFDAAAREWESKKDSDWSGLWPSSAVPVGGEIGPHDVNGHHYSHWNVLFNPRQLMTLASLLNEILKHWDENPSAAEFALGGFQQYVRNQNMFCFWDKGYDKLVPMMSNNNFHPKSNVVENGVFSSLGRGNWKTCEDTMLDGVEWMSNPWDLLTVDELKDCAPELAESLTTKSTKVFPNDALSATNGSVRIDCGSSTQLERLQDEECDLVVTDPPFGGILQYAELADLFYVWLRLALKDKYPEKFSLEYTPKALEAVSNKFRHGESADEFYERLLTDCWREAWRVLKPSGVLVFTFHHSEDEPWVAVLKSLFDAGFYLEATYPIRSDESKGDGAFGSQKIEFDIIHVCRKRLKEPEEISWARLRRQIVRDVRQLQEIIEQHQKEGLGEADLQVIRRGKALEYYSRHYGKVYIEKGRESEFTVKDALAGINQLLDDESDTTNESPPILAEPYTRQFLRLFADRTSVERDQMQKYLRGTGVSPSEFADRGWCSESKKIFHMTPPLEIAQKWKGAPRGGMARDYDQAMFLVGACYENSGIRVQDTLNNPNFTPHPATGDLLDWITRHGGDDEIKNAAKLAKRLYATWEAKNKPKVDAQKTLFDMEDEA